MGPLMPRGGAVKFTYTGIEVRDMDRAIQFYCEGLGMELMDRHEIHETKGEVAGLKSKGSEQILELNWYPRRRFRSGSELDHLAFDVEDSDVDKEIERLVTLGAARARATEVRRKYIVGFVMDPDGIWIELYKVRKPQSS